MIARYDDDDDDGERVEEEHIEARTQANENEKEQVKRALNACEFQTTEQLNNAGEERPNEEWEENVYMRGKNTREKQLSKPEINHFSFVVVFRLFLALSLYLSLRIPRTMMIYFKIIAISHYTN